MTVAELIALLELSPPDSLVLISAGGYTEQAAEIEEGDNYVCISE